VIVGSNDGFWRWNVPAGRILYSRRWAEIIGLRVEELQGTVAEWQAFLHPDERDQIMELTRQTLRGEIAQYDADHRLRHRDGHWVWIRARGRVVRRDADGRAALVAGSCTDVTAVKLAERQLRRTLAENERLIGELRNALRTVTTLTGLLPVCAWCHQVRDEAGHWHSLEVYVEQHAGVQVTHGICPACNAGLRADVIAKQP